jgi:hypothetical protein
MLNKRRPWCAGQPGMLSSQTPCEPDGCLTIATLIYGTLRYRKHSLRNPGSAVTHKPSLLDWPHARLPGGPTPHYSLRRTLLTTSWIQLATLPPGGSRGRHVWRIFNNMVYSSVQPGHKTVSLLPWAWVRLLAEHRTPRALTLWRPSAPAAAQTG